MKTLMPLNLQDRTLCVSYTATLKMESTNVANGAFISLELTLCIRDTPKHILLKTMKNQMKCSIMLHFIRVYTVCKGKQIFRQKNTICFEKNYNLTRLDMYNGLYSQAYCIKLEGRIHLYTRVKPAE